MQRTLVWRGGNAGPSPPSAYLVGWPVEGFSFQNFLSADLFKLLLFFFFSFFFLFPSRWG